MTTTIRPDQGDIGGVEQTGLPTDAELALSRGLIYPGGGWSSDVEVFTVESGEEVEVQVDLGASVTSIQQPVCVKGASIKPHVVPLRSVYSVSGSDGLPIAPDQWRAAGGRIRAKVNEDTTTATLTITGATIPQLSPMMIGESDGQTDYSTLRLLGTGVAFVKKRVLVQTGLTEDQAQQDVGVSIDSPFIRSETQAREAAVRAMGRALGGYQTIQVTGGRAGGLGFGMIGGARVLFDGSWYRVRATTIGPSGISYTAELDMTSDDFDEAWAGVSQADFDAAWAAGSRAVDFDAWPTQWRLG